MTDMTKYGAAHLVGINWLQLSIGLLVLLLGTVVYLVDRAPDTAYFVHQSSFNISFYRDLPNLFGRLGYSLPSFVHVFSFILFTAALLAAQKKTYAFICLGWFLVDCLFELGQGYLVSINAVQSRLAGIPFLENSENYFRYGTFDWNDLLATALGTLVAYAVLLATMNRQESKHEKP